MTVTEIVNVKEFESFTKKGLVLIDFFADWCMPCVMMSPIIDELENKFKGKIKFGKADVDENTELSRKFKIVSIPNFILFKDGKILDRFVGAMSIEDFEEKLRKHL
ncbi:MAG: thioredoxin [Nanoarchaeota archaeon]